MCNAKFDVRAVTSEMSDSVVMAEAVAALRSSDCAYDSFVVVIKIEALGIELSSDPSAHVLVFFVERIAPSVQEVGVAGCAAYVFGRS